MLAMGYGAHVGHSAHERMRALASAWEADGDRRAIFARAYGHMTGAMLAALRSRRFSDDAWVRQLLERFADYYFVAVDGHQHEGDCPQVWRQAFDACTRADVHPLQLLLLGVNAHINHDLVFALADVLGDWPRLDRRAQARRRADHDTVNLVIRETIDLVQDEVVDVHAPRMDTVDRLLGDVDEWVFSRMIAGWRHEVWRATHQLLAADGADREAVVDEVDARTAGIARLILAP